MHFRVAGGIEGGQIAAHAGTDEGYGFARGCPLDDGKLAGDGEPLEIAGSQVRNVDVGSGGFQALAEITGLAGSGRGSEAVKIDDAGHFLMGAGGAAVGKSVNLISVLVVNSLNGS